MSGLACALLAANPARAHAAQEALLPVVANDNTHRAGRLEGATLTVRLRAAAGQWRPEGPHGPVLTVEALGEEGSALTVPAPLIRVAEGTTIAVSIRNELGVTLRVNGLCPRDGSACAPLEIPPESTRGIRFASGRPGTYHYWATSMGAPMPFRELAGAFVVDPAGGAAGDDRIFVITEWNSLTPSELGEIFSADDPDQRFLALRPRLAFVINGLSWPATERLTYHRGDAVRWRVINLSSQAHPMHLHGFYFTVLTMGDGRRDEPVGAGDGRRVVTHVLPSGGTMSLRWTPEREGNWLFHCHIMAHVSPARRLRAGDSRPIGDTSQAAHNPHAQHDESLGMAGMVLGITVLPARNTSGAADRPLVPVRRVTMTIGRGDAAPGETSMGFAVGESSEVKPDAPVSSPGPVLVLRRGEPVDITLVNRSPEPTSIHWHGLEIESYYDGVHGWSGTGAQTAPMIEPGRSFVVRMTPPRAGTFIYHTHLHDYRQLSSGLYGPLVVTEEGESYDPAVDHVVVIGRRDASEASSILQDDVSVVLNGERAPRWVWRAGRRHRIRFINITPDDILTVALVKGDQRLTWRPLAKDGEPMRSGESQPVPAHLRIAVGETYDFDYDAGPGRGMFWLEVRSTSGKWQAQGQVTVK